MNETVVFTQHQKFLPPMELVCLSGPEKGRRISLLEGRRTFGRSQDNDWVLNHETVSQRHGVFVYLEPGTIIFYDTASRNGISCDGRRSPIIRLKLNQQIQIGSLYFQLVRAGQEVQSSILGKNNIWFRSLQRLYLVPLVLSLVLVIFSVLSLSQENHPMTVKESSSPPPSYSRQPGLKNKIKGSQKIKEVRSMKGRIQVEELVQRGQEAFDHDQYLEAHRLWKIIVASDPFHQTALEGLQKLAKVANRFYEEALMLQSSNPQEAQRKFQMVAAMSDPQSEIYSKAVTLAGGKR